MTKKSIFEVKYRYDWLNEFVEKGQNLIFKHSQYRDYLKDYIQNLPRRGFGEAKKMAAHLGLSSTFLSHVLAGGKQLSLEQAFALSGYLGLSALESEYFFCMVQMDRAGTTSLKEHFQKQLTQLQERSQKIVHRVKSEKKMNEAQRAVFYSNALYSGIHIYCATSEKGRTADEVSERFDIPRSKAKEILDFLAEVAMCTEQNGHFLPGNQMTHLEFGSPHLLKHHTNWRLRSIQAAENLSAEELMYTLNVALSKKDYSQLREEMVIFIKRFLEKVQPSPSEEIACLNLDWFWKRK